MTAFSRNSIRYAQWRYIAALQAARHRLKALARHIGKIAARTMKQRRELKRFVLRMVKANALRIGLIAGLAIGLAGCTSIRESRGYVVDALLTDAIQPGIDNQRSVEMTLGRPSFISQYGEPTWYYVSSVNERRPFAGNRIGVHSVLAVQFDDAGNVSSTNRTGMEKVVYLDPDGDKTPTLGRERGFLEDLFGNIGQVGAPGAAGPQ